MNRGKYIVVEGAEGVGKTTIVQMIAAQLQAAQLPVKILREPDSQNDLTARAIRRLTQDPRYPMSTRTEVLLYNAARSQSLEVIRSAVENGVICLVDRSYLTTLAIQYYGRGDVPDYAAINDIINFAVGDMQPDLMMVLDAPASTLKERVRVRSNAERFDNLDEAFLERVRAGYLWEAKQRNLPVVYANEDIDTVFKNVWQHVTNVLSLRNGDAASSKTQSVGEVLAAGNHAAQAQAAAVEPPVITDAAPETPAEETPQTETPADTSPESETEKPADNPPATNDAPVAGLAAYITNTESPVYGFTNALSPAVVAVAMTRLSRGNGAMRAVLVDEFITKTKVDEQLLHQAISAYGSESVQGLTGSHFVVEGASTLLAGTLEQTAANSYMEQSTPYAHFDEKDANGHYRYYVPEEITGKVRSQYIRTMNRIFDLYSGMVGTLTEHIRKSSSTPAAEQTAIWQNAVRAQAYNILQDVLPLATTVTAGMFVSAPTTENMIIGLQASELAEARVTGELLLTEARKIIPALMELTATPEQIGAAVSYRNGVRSTIRNTANSTLPPNHTATSAPVSLSSYTPQNELDIVADMLYPYSDLPLSELKRAVSVWPYQQKIDTFAAYVDKRPSRHQLPGTALEKIQYSFDLTTKYSAFRELQRGSTATDVSWQDFTPRLGYDVPKSVVDAGLTDQFERCFDLSLELHSALHAAKGSQLAQYAVLQGHNVRWKLTVNAREMLRMLELHATPQGGKPYRALALQLYEKITEVHPLTAETMTFINRS